MEHVRRDAKASSRGPRRRRGAVFAVVAGIGLGGVGAAVAATKITAKALDRDHVSARVLGRAIMANPKQLRDAEFLISPAEGSPRVLVHATHEAIAGYPRKNGDFAILSNGCGLRFNHPNYKGATGCDDAGPTFRGTRDATIMRLSLNVPSSATCLSFRFRFLSNEYPVYVGSQYNDAFIAELDHSTWDSAPNDPAITAPDDFAKTVDGHLITINATGVGKVSTANAKGTGYDAGTKVLRASTRITRGRHYLYLSIFDQGDRQFDSAVFLDGLTLDRRSPCTRGIAYDQH